MTIEQEEIGSILSAAQADMQNRQFKNALVSLENILAEQPENIDALYMSAASARYLKDFNRALEFIGKLKSLRPDYGRAHQEEGHTYTASGRQDVALAAYQRACQYNPSLIASWRRQAEIFQSSGNQPAARQAAAQADMLSKQPREILAVMNHLYEGRLAKAEHLCRAFLKVNPTHVEGMRLLAEIGGRLNILDDAEILLESASEFEPDNIPVRLDYIKVLRKRQKYAAALKEAQLLFDSNPDDPVFQSNLAIESMHANDFEKAFELFDKVLERLPGDPNTLASRGHALKTFGRQDDAIASYQAAYQSRPDHGEAYFGLANLKTYQFSDDEITLMQDQEGNGQLNLNSRVQICFSLGKAHEDRGNYKEAFEYYERGNKLKRIQSRYSADDMTAEFAAQKEVCTRALFEKNEGNGHSAPDPVFIVGLPRAGSTLLEQILASHSQVDGTLELPNILSLAHRLRRRTKVTEESQYPKILHELEPAQLEEYGAAYIDETRVHRQGAPFFIDKMPNNFRHIGLIQLILPNAKIIDARRNPMDCCFSGFKQLFAEGQEFTYGLEQIGRYYHDYVDLMDHWDTVLPGKVLHVQYEDVVSDVEAQVRRILDYCGLPFEEACIEFHKTERVVKTASSEQVRQPINKKGLEAWRPFEPWLDELKSALGPVLDRYPGASERS